MILFLGKHDAIVEYVRDSLKMNDVDIFCCPAVTDHHTEFGKYVDVIKEKQPVIVSTQSLEMLDVLLESDLEFEIVRTRRCGHEIRTAKMTKEEVVANRNAWNFDPRN